MYIHRYTIYENVFNPSFKALKHFSISITIQSDTITDQHMLIYKSKIIPPPFTPHMMELKSRTENRWIK